MDFKILLCNPEVLGKDAIFLISNETEVHKTSLLSWSPQGSPSLILINLSTTLVTSPALIIINDGEPWGDHERRDV